MATKKLWVASNYFMSCNALKVFRNSESTLSLATSHALEGHSPLCTVVALKEVV